MFDRHRGRHEEDSGHGSDFDRRYGSRYRDREERAQGHGSEHRGGDRGGRHPDRSYDDRRPTPPSRSTGDLQSGSQRGEHGVRGVGGRVGGQFGDTHGGRPTGDRARGHHAEDQFGGERGRSATDRRYGSRRGHGSRRREDRRIPGR